MPGEQGAGRVYIVRGGYVIRISTNSLAVFLLEFQNGRVVDKIRVLIVKVAQLCPAVCTPWTMQSMEFSRPEHWSGYPFPAPDFPNPGLPRCRRILYQLEPQGKPKGVNIYM